MNIVDPEEGLSPSQYRAARAMLGWGLLEASQRAKVSVSVIARAEKGLDPQRRRQFGVAIQTAYETAGIKFINLDGSERGLIYRSDRALSFDLASRTP